MFRKLFSLSFKKFLIVPVLIATLLISSYVSAQNILLGKLANVSHISNNPIHGVQYLNDENGNTFYETGSIMPQNNATITYDLKEIYCIDSFDIYWLTIPKYFQIFTSLDGKDYYYQYEKFNNISYDSFYGSSEMVDAMDDFIELCNMNHLSYNGGRYIQLRIVNQENNMINIMVRDIEAHGIQISNQITSVSHSIIPLNSRPNIIVQTRMGLTISISTNFCETYHSLSAFQFNELREYHLCFEHYYQNKNISVETIATIFPNIIYAASFIQLTLERNYSKYLTDSPSLIGLSISEDCPANKISSSHNIISNKVYFQEKLGVEEDYYLCYNINNEWGNSFLQIQVVKPKIYKVSGCNDDENRTIKCPTSGGNNLIIEGDNFLLGYSNPTLYFGSNYTRNITRLSSTKLTTVLPEGTGSNLEVYIQYETRSEERTLLSYEKPTIISVSGCDNDYPRTENCPNSGQFKINIFGSNFGKNESLILVGEQICSNVTHYSHGNASCILQGSRGQEIVIYMIQYDGDISEGKNYISYTECATGYQLKGGDCTPCSRGYYKSVVGDISCLPCPEGKVTFEDGSSKCQFCHPGHYSVNGSTACQHCGERAFKKDESSLRCDKCEQNEYTIYQNSTECLNCPLGTYVEENKCVTCLAGYYKDKATDIFCDLCADGTYNNQVGMSTCLKCPDNSVSSPDRLQCLCKENYYYYENACHECDNTDYYDNMLYDCSSIGNHLYTLKNGLGYWRSSREKRQFYKCFKEEYCPVASIENNTNPCLTYHTGVLCHHCLPNYNKDANGVCQPCPDKGDYNKERAIITVIILIIIASFVGIILLTLLYGNKYLNKVSNKLSEKEYVPVANLKDEENPSSPSTNSSDFITNSSDSITNSSDSISNFSSPNNSVSSLISISNLERELSYLERELSYSEIHKVSCSSGLKSQCSMISICSNLSEKKDLEKEKKNNKNSTLVFISDLQKNIQQKIKILISYIQIITILSSNLNIKWPDFMKQVMEVFNAINLDVLDLNGESYKCATNFTYYHNFIMHIVSLPGILLISYITYGFTKLYYKNKNKSQKFYKRMRDRLIYFLVLMTFLLYPGICNSILKIFKCRQVDDKWYLDADLTRECFTSEWNPYAITAGIFFFIYTIGIPLYFYRILKYYKTKKILRKKKVAYKYGFLYLGYKEDLWWFEILELTKKTILSASVIYLDESPTRVMLAILILFAYLMYITYNQPLKNANDAWLAMLSGIELFLLLFCALILEVRIDTQDAYNKVAFEMIMFIIFISTLVVGNYQIVTSLLGDETKEQIGEYMDIWNHGKTVFNHLKKMVIKIKNSLCPTIEEEEIGYIGNDPSLRKIGISELMDELSNVNESESNS